MIAHYFNYNKIPLSKSAQSIHWLGGRYKVEEEISWTVCQADISVTYSGIQKAEIGNIGFQI